METEECRSTQHTGEEWCGMEKSISKDGALDIHSGTKGDQEPWKSGEELISNVGGIREPSRTFEH
jgi:hypothetical protein